MHIKYSRKWKTTWSISKVQLYAFNLWTTFTFCVCLRNCLLMYDSDCSLCVFVSVCVKFLNKFSLTVTASMWQYKMSEWIKKV